MNPNTPRQGDRIHSGCALHPNFKALHTDVGAGRGIMDTPSSIAQAPDGNGGVYMSLQGSGVLDMLEAEGGCVLLIFSIDWGFIFKLLHPFPFWVK